MEFSNRHDARALVLGYWEAEEVASLMVEGNRAHCTIVETSMMLYLMPELVEMRKGFDEYRRARLMLGREEVGQLSRSGTIAETMKSTREKGALIFEAAVRGIVKREEMLDEGVLFD